MTFHSTPPASSVFSSFPPLLGFTARGTQETDIMSLLVDDTNGTVVTATTLTPASQSALCSGSQRVDCLFATELGEFRVWHLILIAVFVAVVALGIICKVIRCQRWPGIKKHRALQTADDIRLEEIESYNNRQESPGSANFDNLPQTTNTHQRGTSPGGSTRSPPPRGQVVTTNPNPEGVYDQVSARASYTPRPLEVQVEMSEVQQQQPVVLYPTQYQLSQPFNERSVDEPMSLSMLQDDRQILSAPTISHYGINTTALYGVNLTGEDGRTEEDYPKKSSFRKGHKNRRSYHFEKPRVSFRLDTDYAQDPPKPDVEDTDTLPDASHHLSLQRVVTVPLPPAPVPTPYRRFGSFNDVPYAAPVVRCDLGGARSRDIEELEESASSTVLSATEV